jgi:hypothetical protein
MLQGHGRTSPLLYRAALSCQYNVVSFATLRVLSCLHSPGLCCSCCNASRFCCNLEPCNLMTATKVTRNYLHFIYPEGSLLTRARRWTLSKVRWVQSTFSRPMSLVSVLMLSPCTYLGLRSGIFSSGFQAVGAVTKLHASRSRQNRTTLQHEQRSPRE